MTEVALERPRESAVRLFMEVSRFHIIAIASLAALTFGWIFTGKHFWLPLALCALDWFIVNLTNRVVDLAEDRANGIVGTDLIARSGRALEILCVGLLVGSFAANLAWFPALLAPRAAFHLIGLAYNYKLLPSRSGRTRFKEVYFFKNFSSAVLFILSTQVYPAVLGGWPEPGLFWTMVAFFLPLEITYEIFYDLRDVKGDLELKVPTFPVVHGVAWSHAIIWALIGMSAAALVVGGALGAIGFREVVLLAAPIQQALYFHFRIRPDPTPARCIFVTWLGAGQVLSYNVWIWLGLPTTL